MEAVWRMGEGFLGGGGAFLLEISEEGSFDFGGARALMRGFEMAVVGFGWHGVDARRLDAVVSGGPLAGAAFFLIGSGFFSRAAMVF